MKKLLLLVPFIAITSMIYSADSDAISIDLRCYTPGRGVVACPTLEFTVNLENDTLASLADKINSSLAQNEDPNLNGLVVAYLIFGTKTLDPSDSFTTLKQGVSNGASLQATLKEDSGRYIKGDE